MTERIVVGQAATPFIPTAATEYPEVPDTTIDYGSLGGLQLRAASVRGYGHRYSPDAWSIPRQDAYCFRVSEDGRWFVGVVCDGVSSGKRSHHAAIIAARSCSRSVLKQLSDKSDLSDLEGIDWKPIVQQTAVSIVNEYNRRAKNPVDLKKEDPFQIITTVSPVMATTAVAVVIDLKKRTRQQTVAASENQDAVIECEVASEAGETIVNPVENKSLEEAKVEGAAESKGEASSNADVESSQPKVADSSDLPEEQGILPETAESSLDEQGTLPKVQENQLEKAKSFPEEKETLPVKTKEESAEQSAEKVPSDEYYACQVINLAGDSSIWKLNATEWQPLFAEKRLDTAIASNRVYPLPAISTPHIAAVELTEGEALFLMTDGVGDPLQDGKGELGRALKERWLLPPDPYQFAADVDFSRRSYDDDRTVLGVWWPEEQNGAS
ncbi:protein phosphatase 2C domain-containing protein [Varibaculum massiliense]|uniref:protein phosphatase 2C domain-containing protein n=1 Tax=Varibaculum massiliense TaxID=1852372 RepID=UPI00288BFC9F|nr:protein phosphatase 2C domain-containing protein [Varibaculum massiliense]